MLSWIKNLLSPPAHPLYQKLSVGAQSLLRQERQGQIKFLESERKYAHELVDNGAAIWGDWFGPHPEVSSLHIDITNRTKAILPIKTNRLLFWR